MEYLFHNPVFIVFASLVLMCVIPSITYSWYKVRQAEIEANLKRDMLQRGMSAADIERVLQACAERK